MHASKNYLPCKNYSLQQSFVPITGNSNPIQEKRTSNTVTNHPEKILRPRFSVTPCIYVNVHPKYSFHSYEHSQHKGCRHYHNHHLQQLVTFIILHDVHIIFCVIYVLPQLPKIKSVRTLVLTYLATLGV